MNPDYYDDEEQTSITDTQPISRALNGLNKKMQELDEICHQTTIKLQALKLARATGGGAEMLKQT